MVASACPALLGFFTGESLHLEMRSSIFLRLIDGCTHFIPRFFRKQVQLEKKGSNFPAASCIGLARVQPCQF
jgi:hypothetical protein